MAKVNQRFLRKVKSDKLPGERYEEVWINCHMSKVDPIFVKTLEEDLIVERKGIIRLLQSDKLLEKLSENYVPPNIKERVRLKISEESGTIGELLMKLSQALDLPLVAAGTSSAGRYAVMQRGDLLSIYCPRLEILLERLPGSRSDRFPNLELIETED